MTEIVFSPIVNGTKENAEPIVENNSNINDNTVATNENLSAETANGTTNGNITNGKIVKTKEESEPPKDPKEDPVGWLKQQSNAAIHKVNFHVLYWVQKHSSDDETKLPPIPRKNNLDFTTRRQVVNYLKDGQLLASLANKFAPGSVETVHENEALKEKSNQISNIQGFIKFAKEKAGISEENVFTVEDLQEKGKAGYNAVVNTLFHLGLKAEEKFNQTGLNIENIIEEVKKVVDPNFLQKLTNLFNAGLSAITTKLTRQQSTNNSNPSTSENASETNGTSEKTKVELESIQDDAKKANLMLKSSEPVASAQ